MPLPRSRLLRILLGTVLFICGLLGFLPVIGYWMIPLGLVVLSVDIPIVRRWRRRVEVRFGRWWQRRREAKESAAMIM
jgi:purine-cytosine permease-like protein